MKFENRYILDLSEDEALALYWAIDSGEVEDLARECGMDNGQALGRLARQIETELGDALAGTAAPLGDPS